MMPDRSDLIALSVAASAPCCTCLPMFYEKLESILGKNLELGVLLPQASDDLQEICTVHFIDPHGSMIGFEYIVFRAAGIPFPCLLPSSLVPHQSNPCRLFIVDERGD
ncbi:hypothetical protein [Microvirga sp. VF16]|uniref:hypothetical protein n=1 Tax=Microvirga sp. VF16 TaxID=2807101 RepID=UPI00193E5C7C|nr:hypothetical protein [Microvirga sp. VF16]QRM35981.1 hypothetical protein JO965_47275 [Microvirga sp. VF16]